MKTARIVLEPGDQLMTLTEVSAITQVPVNTLYAMRYRGEGPPAVRIGRALRFTRGDVAAWLTANRERTGASR